MDPYADDSSSDGCFGASPLPDLTASPELLHSVCAYTRAFCMACRAQTAATAYYMPVPQMLAVHQEFHGVCKCNCLLRRIVTQVHCAHGCVDARGEPVVSLHHQAFFTRPTVYAPILPAEPHCPSCNLW